MHTNHATGFSAKVQATTDMGWLLSLSRIGNRRQRHLASVRIRELAPAKVEVVKVASTVVHVAPSAPIKAKVALSPEELKAKRSEAAKRAAATRRARAKKLPIDNILSSEV